MNRRAVLGAVGCTGATALAGCSGLLSESRTVVDSTRIIEVNQYVWWNFEIDGGSDVEVSVTVREGPAIDVLLLNREEFRSYERGDRIQYLDGSQLDTVVGLAGCTDIIEQGDSTQDNEDSTESNGGLDTDSLSTEEDVNIPFPEAREEIHTSGQLVEVNSPVSQTYTATIENTGVSGNIAVALIWQLREGFEVPDNVEPEQQTAEDVFGWEHERTEQMYFDTGERRPVEFTVSPPEETHAYVFVTNPATYGARIQNLRDPGDVSVTLRYDRGHEEFSTEVIERKEVFIGAQETDEVLFNVILSYPEADWTVEAWPAV